MFSHSAQDQFEQILRDAGVDVSGLAAKLAESTSADEVSRSLLMSRTQSAFREGFLLGKRWPKFAPYVTDIWRKSDFYNRHFAKRTAHPDFSERYAKYNDFG